MKRKSSDLTEFYIQFLIVVYLLWSFPVLSFGQKEVLVPADGTVSEGEEQPVVALTFDDGPSGTSTPVLLEGLRKRGVRATFFVVGENVEKGENAQILREMSADGHLIGNHTYHHVNLSKMSAEQAQAELDATDELVRKITGKYFQFFIQSVFPSCKKNMCYPIINQGKSPVIRYCGILFR